MNKSDDITELAKALVKIQAQLPKIPKDANNPFFKSKYADLPTVIEKASPIVTVAGVAVVQMMDGASDGSDTLTTLVVHESGQWIAATSRLHLVKDDPQAHGSAVTYARRYAYMAALGLVADEDDDGNRASRPVQQTREQKPRTAPRPQVRPSPITEAEAVAKVEAAFGPNQDVIPENSFQRTIYAKARKAGLTATQLNELCTAAVECDFSEIDSPDKANSVLAHIQAQEAETA